MFSFVWRPIPGLSPWRASCQSFLWTHLRHCLGQRLYSLRLCSIDFFLSAMTANWLRRFFFQGISVSQRRNWTRFRLTFVSSRFGVFSSSSLPAFRSFWSWACWEFFAANYFLTLSAWDFLLPSSEILTLPLGARKYPDFISCSAYRAFSRWF